MTDKPAKDPIGDFWDDSAPNYRGDEIKPGQCGECGAELSGPLEAVAHFNEAHPLPGDVRWAK
jgi:hypothetical protein